MNETRLEVNIDSQGLTKAEVLELVNIALKIYIDKYNTEIDYPVTMLKLQAVRIVK